MGNIKKMVLVFYWVGVLFASNSLYAQQFIPLWKAGAMPNSKGLKLADSISGERYRQVGTPGLLAFFTSKQENTGAAVVICPGGGYKHYAYDISGMQIAKWFNTMGINAFVLISRLPHSPDLIQRDVAPLQDAQRAIKLIRSNARIWEIQINKVGVMGFSAGGHVASTLGTHFNDVSFVGDKLDTFSTVPDFMLLVSPVITMGEFTHTGSRDNLLGENPPDSLIEKYSNELWVTDKTPPAFIALADNDKSVSPENSLLFYTALRKQKVKASLFIFTQGGHSLALRNNPGTADYWPALCESWLHEMHFIEHN